MIACTNSTEDQPLVKRAPKFGETMQSRSVVLFKSDGPRGARQRFGVGDPDREEPLPVTLYQQSERRGVQEANGHSQDVDVPLC
jgi:hypothetical protein